MCKKWVLLKMGADDDQWMCPHNVNHCIAAKLRQMVRADNDIVISTPNIIYTRFEFDYISNPGLISGSPIHSADNAAHRKPFRGSTRPGDLLKCSEHTVLIETPLSQIGFSIDLDIELSVGLMGGGVDAFSSQPAQVVLALPGIDDMDCLVPTRQAFLNKGK